MTTEKKQLINEYIAEKLFGLEKGVDFGEWEHHDWILDSDGDIDLFAFEYEFHNGPMCSRCDESFCIHCVEDSDEALNSGPCVVEAPDYFNRSIEVWSVFMQKYVEYDIHLSISNISGQCFDIVLSSHGIEKVRKRTADLKEGMVEAVYDFIKGI